MKHTLAIRVTKNPVNDGVVTCRTITLRERFLRFLFGAPQKLTVIVPGDTVDEIAIRETPGGEKAYEAV